MPSATGLATSRGVHVTDQALDVLLDFADTSIINRRFPDKALDLLEQAVARAIVAGRTNVDRHSAIETTELWKRRASSTPTLDRFGRDLVALARAGKLGPIVGRDREIDAIVDVLLRRTKRNPLLLGAAGTGKTAIVEGLAIRIAAGNVPAALADVRIFDTQLLTLAGAMGSDPRILDDFLLEARHPSIVVFFDEIHLLGSPAVRDLGQALKPALARGEIACIGATTGEEYQASLELDAALARRFSIVPIQPMDPTAVHAVLVAVRDSLAKARGVRVDDDAIDELTALAGQFLPNRAFPDKGVDLIEQSVAYATTHGKASVDVATARDAVAAMTGMPIDPAGPIDSLTAEIGQRGLLGAAASAALQSRLRVSLRGLDAQTRRPDAVILLCGSAADSADPLAGAIASLDLRPTRRRHLDRPRRPERGSVDLDAARIGSGPRGVRPAAAAPGAAQIAMAGRPLPRHRALRVADPRNDRERPRERNPDRRDGAGPPARSCHRDPDRADPRTVRWRRPPDRPSGPR